MLEHVPEWLGRALKGMRAGADKLCIAQAGSGFASLQLNSPAFADGARLPIRYTADGAGVSPPLLWSGVPEGTQELALIVEDADAPTPQPIVHALIYGLPPENGALPEGAIAPELDDEQTEVGRNSYFRQSWLPPDPPTGHGEHRYVFQLFALAAPLPEGSPKRSALVKAMAGQVLAAGLLTGTYSRGDPAPTGLVGSAVPAGAPARP